MWVHLTLFCLNILREKGIQVYALLAQTSGVTQALDVSVFVPFKKRINSEIYWLINGRREVANCRGNISKNISQYDLCGRFRFTRSNIVSGFQNRGIFPFNPGNVMKRPKPHQE